MATAANETGIRRWIDWYRIVAVAALAASIALTYRQWISSRDFPLTPIFDGLPSVPYPFDHALVVLMLAALLGIAAMRRPAPAIGVALVIAIVWIATDQSRLQPYFVQFMAMIAALVLIRWRDLSHSSPESIHWALAPVRLLLVCTYVFAGLQKLNYDFAEFQFAWFLGPLARNVGIAIGNIDPVIVTIAALASAMFEFSCGIMLVFARTRRAALIGLTAVHVMIMLAIGPTGHNDNLAVWPWNAAQILILWIVFHKIQPDVATLPRMFSMRWWRALFGGSVDGDARASIKTTPTVTQRVATIGALVFFGLLPFAGLFGLWDSYLSFALYSGNTYDALLLVDSTDLRSMPPSMRRSMRADGTLDPFNWSLDDLHTSLYPEKRVLISIGRALARRAEKGDVYLRYTKPPDRFTGARAAENYRFPRGGGEPEMVVLPGDANAQEHH